MIDINELLNYLKGSKANLLRKQKSRGKAFTNKYDDD